MNLNLHGRTAVVTGATKGAGLDIARALVDEGAAVVTGSRQVGPELQKLADDAALA